MEHLIQSVLITIIILIGMGILLLIFTFKRMYSYWEKFNIPLIPARIPYGSLGNPFTKTTNVSVKVADAYKKFKESNQKYGGIYIYLIPYYIPIDPVIIKNIVIKDFNYFSERNMYFNKKKDPLSVNLFNVEGQEWKDMRNKLTPLFTIHKLKLMFPLFQIHSDRLVKKVNDCVNRMEPVKINDLLGCFTTDIMGSCTFGVECNSIENENCTFNKIGKKVFHLNAYRFLQGHFNRNFSNLARFLGVVTFSKQFYDFIITLVNKSFDYRINNNMKHNDFFQSLMELEKNETDDNIKKAKIAAQLLLFFNAGSESSAITATYAIYELACNRDIQDKLRNEVISILEKHNGEITYEALLEMEYLSKVVDETLRKYPASPSVVRRCVQDYHVKGTDFVIKKGVTILISILGIHKDPEYYPNPEVFDPERFSETNKSKRPPCTYLPFFDGPRNCIGLKLALLQAKLGLVSLLKNFKFSINSKTGTPVFDANTFLLRFFSDIYIDFEKI